MKRNYIFIGVLFGFLTSLVATSVSFLANLLLGLPFFPFDLYEGITRLLPARFIETILHATITLITTLHLGSTDKVAKIVEQLQGLGLTLFIGALVGFILVLLGLKHKDWLKRAAEIAGALFIMVMVAIEFSLPQSSISLIWVIAWLILLLGAWCFWLYSLIQNLLGLVLNTSSDQKVTTLATTDKLTRRNFLVLAFSGIASLVILSLGLGKNSLGNTTSSGPTQVPSSAVVPKIDLPYGPQYTSGLAASPSLETLANRLSPAVGVQSEVTSVDNFYRVDIDLEPPKVDLSTWRLTISGSVQTPMSLSLDDLVALPSVSQAVTMACISNLVGGSLISSNYWTGVSLQKLLGMAGVQSGAGGISITAADGFYDSLSLTEAMDERTLLVYAMNGQALTDEHGAPLRIYIPDHYGMKLPKWITKLEVMGGIGPGYWEDRGWSHTAIPQTTSWFDTRSFDASTLNQDGTFSLGGYAWAGSRSITRVELQFDNNAWVEAELIAPALSPLTWVSWRYDWKPSPGTHQVRVRATDETGALQDDINVAPFPEGATGLDVINLSA